jgi:hypothetical protein
MNDYILKIPVKRGLLLICPRPVLCVMFVFSKVAAGFVLLVMHPCALACSDNTVSLCSPFDSSDFSLILTGVGSLPPRQVTTCGTLPNPVALHLLALVGSGRVLSLGINNTQQQYKR